MVGPEAAAAGGDRVMMRTIALAAGLLVAGAAPAAAPASLSAPAPADWSTRVTKTAEGGYRLGNPEARFQLVEFLSLTCGACAAFAGEALPQLKDHVRNGRVSIEYRNHVLNPYDFAAALLSRCAATSNYFALTEAFLAEQPSWAGRIAALPPAQRAQVEVEPAPATLKRIADLLGLKEIAARHGVTPAKAAACLADPAGIAQLKAMRDASEQLGVQFTPSFALNGTVIGPLSWSSLQPVLGQP